MFYPSDHTFVVCAYKYSPWIEDCIQSVLAQTVLHRVLITTSTPSEWLDELAKKYDIPLIVGEHQPGIAADWNFALSQVETALATLCHQDDLLEPTYLQTVLEQLNRAVDPLIFFSNYGEIRDQRALTNTGNLFIKRALLLPVRVLRTLRSRMLKRSILAFGNAICCPSVTYVMDRMVIPVFKPGLKSNLDWEAWEQLSRSKGSFVYSRRILLWHRIHAESETTRTIESQQRTNEDFIVFRKFWPTPFAKILSRIYALSERSNRIE